MPKRKKKVTPKLKQDAYSPPPHEGFEADYLPNGELMCRVKMGFSVITCTFDPRIAHLRCAMTLTELAAQALRGEKVGLANPGAYAELGIVRFLFTDLQDIEERIAYYTTRAWHYYMGALVSKLEDLPAQLLTQAILAAITDMNNDGFLHFKEPAGATGMWDCYLDSLRETIKKEWNKPKTGPKKFWTPYTRKVLLGYYESKLKDLTEAKAVYEENKHGDWLAQIDEKFPNMKVSTARRLEHEKPEDLAREFTLEHLGRSGDESFAKQLRQAKAERKKAESEKIPREVDITNMYSIDFEDGRIVPKILSYKKLS